MSAYLVTDSTIDVIVHAAVKYGVITAASADAVGTAIKHQNRYALHCRYGDELPAVTEYAFTAFSRKVQRITIDSCIRCWNYQCSEFEGCDETAISRLIQLVRERNAARIPAYDEAAVRGPWGVDNHEQAMVPARTV
jgi:hypothetical protein